MLVIIANLCPGVLHTGERIFIQQHLQQLTQTRIHRDAANKFLPAGGDHFFLVGAHLLCVILTLAMINSRIDVIQLILLRVGIVVLSPEITKILVRCLNIKVSSFQIRQHIEIILRLAEIECAKVDHSLDLNLIALIVNITSCHKWAAEQGCIHGEISVQFTAIPLFAIGINVNLHICQRTAALISNADRIICVLFTGIFRTGWYGTLPAHEASAAIETKAANSTKNLFIPFINLNSHSIFFTSVVYQRESRSQ